MRLWTGLGLILALGAAASLAAVLPVIPGDSSRGAKLFETEQCIHCHAVNGRGGKMGLDLGRVVSRNYTPAHLASAMWNHAPTMWGAIEAAKHQDVRASLRKALPTCSPTSTPRDSSTSPASRPAARRCSIAGSAPPVTASTIRAPRAPSPVAQWESLADPILLVQQMWNHSYRMRQAFARRA